MKLTLCIIGFVGLAGFLGICGSPTESAAAEKPRPSFPHARDAVVRVYVDGRYAGSGIVVSGHGHIVTSLRIIRDRRDHTKIAVDDGTVTAKMVAEDPAHDLALIKADKTYRWPAVLSDRKDDQQGNVVTVIGYSEVLSNPPVVEKRAVEAHVSRLHYRGESVSGLDLSDICLVAYQNDERGKIKEEGSAAFLAGTGKLLGMGFGRIWQSNELMLMPADTIRTFIKNAGLSEGSASSNPL